jgi:hypothetical protein
VNGQLHAPAALLPKERAPDTQIFVKLFSICFTACVIIISYYNGPPAWGLGEGLTTPHRKNQLVR